MRFASVFLFRAAAPLLWSVAWSAVAHAEAPRVLAWDHDIAARKLALVTGAGVVPINGMHPLKRTDPLRGAGTGACALRALDKPPGADGKPVQASFTIPENLTHPLVLVMPAPEQPAGVRAFVINDDPANFAWGAYRFLNATNQDLAIKLEDKAIKIPAGWKERDIDLGGETRGIGAEVAAVSDLKNILYSAVWEYDKGVRTLVFMVPGTDPRLSPVQFKAVPEQKRMWDMERKGGERKDGEAKP